MSTISQRRVAKRFGLKNVWAASRAAKKVGLPFEAACALLQKESGGRNVYGHDVGGALSGFPGTVNRDNFAVFEWMISHGWSSNGVGPCQITWKGYFTDMQKRGLLPWKPYDNMVFGFGILRAHRDRFGSWTLAGGAYNGSSEYGADLNNKINEWKKRFASA